MSITERASPPGASANLLTAIGRRVEHLEQRTSTLEDIHAIRLLQHAYGEYLDNRQYDEVVALFSEAGEASFMGKVFRGDAGLRRLYSERFQESFTGGSQGTVHGLRLDHPELQDIIEVAPDRKTARGRFRNYENEYVNEAGVWKISVCGHVRTGEG